MTPDEIDVEGAIFANEMLEEMRKSARVVNGKLEITITPAMVERALNRVNPEVPGASPGETP